VRSPIDELNSTTGAISRDPDKFRCVRRQETWAMFGLFKRHASVRDDQPDGAARNFFRACNVYCRPESDEVIVASVFNHGGPTAEKPGGATITKYSDTSLLSDTVRASLACCEYQEHFDYSHLKPSDWPAYQASGYETINHFETNFIRLGVRAVNDANLFYNVTTPKFGEFGLHLTITINAHEGHYGEAVQYIVKQYLICKATVDACALRKNA
jgi:hypothetical protein